jgi:hypothetical protein
MSNALKTTMLLAALTALFIVIGGALGGQSGIAERLVGSGRTARRPPPGTPPALSIA